MKKNITITFEIDSETAEVMFREMKEEKDTILLGNDKAMSINDLLKVVGDTLSWEVLDEIEC